MTDERRLRKAFDKWYETAQGYPVGDVCETLALALFKAGWNRYAVLGPAGKVSGKDEKVLLFKEDPTGPEYARVFPAYSMASKENQLLCLQNLRSWIDGERMRLEVPEPAGVQQTQGVERVIQEMADQLKGDCSRIGLYICGWIADLRAALAAPGTPTERVEENGDGV